MNKLLAIDYIPTNQPVNSENHSFLSHLVQQSSALDEELWDDMWLSPLAALLLHQEEGSQGSLCQNSTKKSPLCSHFDLSS